MSEQNKRFLCRAIFKDRTSLLKKEKGIQIFFFRQMNPTKNKAKFLFQTRCFAQLEPLRTIKLQVKPTKKRCFFCSLMFP
jgi:type I restriction-modification system DNA methylase subunit